jgi:hypothetical protein
MRRAVGAHRIHHDFARQLASLLHLEARLEVTAENRCKPP